MNATFCITAELLQRFERRKDGPMEMRFSSTKFSVGLIQGSFVSAEIFRYGQWLTSYVLGIVKRGFISGTTFKCMQTIDKLSIDELEK